MRRWLVMGALGALATSGVAHAGGFDLPDQGAEALGRGGAFAAKADNPTALYYNVSGIARQRGTNLSVDANLIFHDIAFTRAGSYEGNPSDPATPWGGQPYPTMHDSSPPFVLPMLALTSDFNYFKRWTFGFAVYGPPSVGWHNYGVDTPGSEVATTKLPNGMVAPAPSRYDISQVNLLIVYPTLAVGFSANKYLDLGIAAQLVWGKFSLANANATPLGNTCVGGPEYPGCDAYGVINTTGFSWGALISAMVHPTTWLDIGLQFRPQIDIHSEGTIKPVVPGGLTAPPDSPATFNTIQPHHLRFGIRAVRHFADGGEQADIELDATYENWGTTKDRWGRDPASVYACADPNNCDHNPVVETLKHQNDVIYSSDFGLGSRRDPNGQTIPGELHVDLNHGLIDTMSIRLGGAWNWRLSPVSTITARAGGFFDSAATHYEHTRLDFNTAAKYALTLGGGYTWKGLTVNLAYAFVYSPTREVTNSALRAISATNGTDYGPSEPVIIVGNGKYQYSTQIVSLGLTLRFDDFKKKGASAPAPAEATTEAPVAN